MKLFVGIETRKVTTGATVISESAMKPAGRVRRDLIMVVIDVNSTTLTWQ